MRSWNSDFFRLRFLPALALILAVAIVHGLAVPGADLADGDSWLRLLRVRRLLEGLDWYDTALPGLDAPFGSSSHWTRPLDLLILVLVLPLRIGLDLPDALHWAGLLVSPVLHAATALVLAWALVPLCGRAGGWLGGALTLAQPAILAYGGPGHADHHILFLLVTAALLGLLLRGLGGRPGALLLAGGMAASGVWVSVEMLLVLGLVLAVLGLAWVMGADRGAQGNRLFARGLAWGLIAALVLERPGADWLSVEYDRLSVVHVALGGLVLAFWTLAGRRPEEGSRPGRLIVAVLGVGIVAVLWRAAFPGVFRGPAADVPPDLWALLANQIAEYQGIQDPATFLVLAGGTLFALPWAAWRLAHGSRGGKKVFWGLVLLGLTVFLSLSLVWVRWGPYLELFVAVALADLLVAGDGWLGRALPAGGKRALAKMGLAAAAIVAPLAAGAALRQEVETSVPGPDCRIEALAPVLETSPWSDRSRIVLAPANFGPELAYRTRHRAVAGLYHRGAGGLRDSLRIFSSRDDAVAFALLALRQVDLILTCPGPEGGGLLAGDGSPETFYRRLPEGRLPPWVREVPLPSGAGLDFRLFEVRRSGRP